MLLTSPCAYQGGKSRVAKDILAIINPNKDYYFVDGCCGSGAISIELVNSGFPLDKIIMIDKGPWGLFWQMVGDGSFDLNIFKKYIDQIPKEIGLIQGFIKELSKQSADIDTPYVYLLLQASSFGSKAIWIEDNKWKNCSFRNLRLPTATSNRRSIVNPMVPMPNTLLARVELICEKMRGVDGCCGDINALNIPENAIVYCDPPYSDTTLYGHDFDVVSFARKIKNKVFISEGKPLSENSHKIENVRKKGGISGERKTFNEEWLSEFN